ncbi:hypothetical protein LX32DRAFT_426275 [Colletotrichum zoysiae]|uniref:Uncharacterized protein n=1 Tax=Colletotrichum zoysiae TaxID=1216348 RepID=A0AAD9M0X1_9PEZI|nr:hypothetical protein LX32DRAFT_426275 [Colletotrichum zoysiae]
MGMPWSKGVWDAQLDSKTNDHSPAMLRQSRHRQAGSDGSQQGRGCYYLRPTSGLEWQTISIRLLAVDLMECRERERERERERGMGLKDNSWNEESEGAVGVECKAQTDRRGMNGWVRTTTMRKQVRSICPIERGGGVPKKVVISASGLSVCGAGRAAECSNSSSSSSSSAAVSQPEAVHISSVPSCPVS